MSTKYVDFKDKAGNILVSKFTKEYVDERVLDTYSTDEVKTNKIWIDGKPIYRKVINVGKLPNNTTTQYPKNIFDGSDKTITTMNCVATSNAGETLKIPYYSINSYVHIFINSNYELSIETNADRSRFVGYVTLEYTKNK